MSTVSDKKWIVISVFAIIAAFAMMVVFSVRSPRPVISCRDIRNGDVLYAGEEITAVGDFLRIVDNSGKVLKQLSATTSVTIPESFNEETVTESHVMYDAEANGWLIRVNHFYEDDKYIMDKDDLLESDLPDGTVIATDRAIDEEYILRSRQTEGRSMDNHIALANAFMNENLGCDAYVVLTKDIYPRIALDDGNRGHNMGLAWRSCGIRPGTPVYAMFWSEWDGVYWTQGMVDDAGVAAFDNYILRDAATISIVVPGTYSEEYYR